MAPSDRDAMQGHERQKTKRLLNFEWRPAFALLTIAALVLAVRVLPPKGFGLGLKVVVVGYAVLLLPGALIARVLSRETPRSLAAAAAVSLPWSLMAVFVALGLTFLADQDLRFTITVLSGVSLLALAAGSIRLSRTDGGVPRNHPVAAGDHPDDQHPTPRRWSEMQVQLAIIGAAILFALVVWKALPAVIGDGLEHLSRARKLAEFDTLESASAVDQYRDAGLDPGYAFPLWHAVLALVARIGRADVADVIRYLAPVLVPLSLLLLYGAGASLFGSPAGGIMVAALEVARLGFAFGAGRGMNGAGWFVYLSWPGQASILVLVPAILALTFSFARSGKRSLLLSIAAGAFVLTVIHASYGPFLAIPLLGFLLARVWLCPKDGILRTRLIASLGALLVASGLFFAWLLPVLESATFYGGGREIREGAVRGFGSQLEVFNESSFRIAPNFLVSGSGGAVSAAALLAIPAAVLTPRRRWAAFVLGGSLVIFAIVLIPPLFTSLSSFASVSQLRRLAPFFVPWSFALTGGLLLLSRVKGAALGVSLAAAALLQLHFPAIWQRRSEQPPLDWPVWFAVVAGVAALVAGRFISRQDERFQPRWAVAAALAFIVPLAISGLSDLRYRPDGKALTPGLIRVLQRNVDQREVVFSTPTISYRIQAHVPVYVAAVTRGHARATASNRHLERFEDALRFFRNTVSNAQRRAILEKYDVTWIVIPKDDYPRDFFEDLAPLYDDQRYALYSWPG